MSDHDSTLLPRAPFADLPDWSARAGCGQLVVTDRDGLGIATVHARKGRTGQLADRLRERFGIELPCGPLRTTAGDLALAGVAPQAWLATCEAVGNRFAAAFQEATTGLASVCDQSDGYAVLRLSGPSVRETLCKLVSIDLHPRAFPVGAVAVTSLHHIGATLWRLSDESGERASFEVAVYRSYASSFWQVLRASAAAGSDPP